MPTAAERQALVFIVAVALVGGGVRALDARRVARESVGEVARGDGTEGVETQLAAVDAERQQAFGARARNARPKGRPRVGGSLAAASADTSKQPGASPRRRGGANVAMHDRSPTRSVAIDVDAASAEDLERLPRIGATLAQRIVANRDSLGAFGSLQALTRVRGIGPAMVKHLEPLVTFSGGPSPFHGQLPKRYR